MISSQRLTNRNGAKGNSKIISNNNTATKILINNTNNYISINNR